jgi:hypothetical protein
MKRQLVQGVSLKKYHSVNIQKNIRLFLFYQCFINQNAWKFELLAADFTNSKLLHIFVCFLVFTIFEPIRLLLTEAKCFGNGCCERLIFTFNVMKF